MTTLPSAEGPELLSEISVFIRKFVILSQAQADVCALWVLHTHATDAAEFTPYLHIYSPVLRSGKTRLLEVLRMLVHRPWFTGRVTGSALVRKTDKDHPSLLLDESDAAFQSKGDYPEALRGILNSGFERDGTYSMSVQNGKIWEPRDFSTFSPKAIAGIGRLPGTVEDRAIPIHLKRKLRHEASERFRKRKVKPEGDQLSERCFQWAKENLEALRIAVPSLPDELNDRQQDVCEPLLAIADASGGEWPTRAHVGLLELCTGQPVPDDATGLRLLADIRICFLRRGADRISSANLLDDLKAMDEAPWADFHQGWPLNTQRIARLLKPFDICPRDIRFGSAILKGYTWADFVDSWERYLPGDGAKGQQGQQTANDAGVVEFGNGQQAQLVATDKYEKSPADTRTVAGVAPTNRSNGTSGCYVHPLNETQWWERADGDRVCGLCHPNPAALDGNGRQQNPLGRVSRPLQPQLLPLANRG